MQSTCLYKRPKRNYQWRLRDSKQLNPLSIFPVGCLVTATFAKLQYIFQFFLKSITSTRMFALSSNSDENKDKASEKSHNIIYSVSYLHAAPTVPSPSNQGTNALERHECTSSSRKHCFADVHCASLKSSSKWP